MKRLTVLLSIALLLAACSEEASEEPKAEDTAAETEAAVEEPTQEDLNTQIKEEAVEIEFVKANADEVAEGTQVRATGEVSNLVNDTMIEFTLKTEEGEGFGMYSIKGFNTTEAEVQDGQTVTIYGTYSGKDDASMPAINVTIIE